MRTGTINLKEYFDFLGNDGANPVLDYYLPYNMAEMGWQDKKRPVLLICPGGGYGFVSQREGEPIAFNYLTRGFNVFVLKYSIEPLRYPHQLLETAASFELIKRNAEEWGCDMEKCAIMGFSAGGHLCAHYSTSYNSEDVKKYFPESVRPAVSVLAYPVITAEKGVTHYGSIYNLLGHSAKGEEVEKFSCEMLVNETTPPAYIWTTSDDSGVPPENSFRYASALAKQGIYYELHVFAHGGHGLATANTETLGDAPERIREVSSWMTESADFMYKVFNKIQ